MKIDSTKAIIVKTGQTDIVAVRYPEGLLTFILCNN